MLRTATVLKTVLAAWTMDGVNPVITEIKARVVKEILKLNDSRWSCNGLYSGVITSLRMVYTRI